MLGVIFSSFNFYIYFESSVLLMYFLWRNPLRGLSLNVISAIPKYILSGLLDADNTVLYTMLAVKHLLSSRKFHGWLSEVGWIIL